MNTTTQVFKQLTETINQLDIQSVSDDRKAVLQPLVDFIQTKVNAQDEIRINFICTHNSRRSHLSQVWAQTIARFLAIKNVKCYSGGTEATALFPVIAQTLKEAGFQVNLLSTGENPVYSIKYGKNEHPILGFSKKLDDAFNPSSDFAAVLTCDSANEACPFVTGATKRIPITFEDPKAFDNTPLQAEKYKERSLQIATELLFIFSQITR
ncbi:arsenate reductase [Leeuwenhoekiella aestuarii]|uniref:Arsenate reductase n=1 Tax=Leeuwenhoekiella aestuarii TaxID=2249426 RepID=A0A4Q0NQP6_9FLAO|nr:protein-tyrosine-phosphatase [Leeuwenhoekiella aestuarii]RXG11327.1 arsenate reductase [Leeuwenhoekiella aestuarii]RXG11865.1 arsenate reductase [Leeuwenhoekiella aestuarii]